MKLNTNTHYPKISIVTPSYNQGEYIEETILSIINQGYPNLEYIIIDGGSTDNTIDIIKKYEKHITYWVSEPDEGMYNALNKGFAKTTGEIMGWLNSDDLLHSKSLFTLAELFQLPEVKWLQGIATNYDEHGKTINVNKLKQWSKYNFWTGDYRWIQQESTFWHRDLWERAGNHISQDYKLAGDFELWNRFFKYEKLYTPSVLIGGFRFRTQNQLSHNINSYLAEAESILNSNRHSKETFKTIKSIKKLKKLKKILSKTRIFNTFAFIFRINKKIDTLFNYPENIIFDNANHKLTIKTDEF